MRHGYAGTSINLDCEDVPRAETVPSTDVEDLLSRLMFLLWGLSVVLMDTPAVVFDRLVYRYHVRRFARH